MHLHACALSMSRSTIYVMYDSDEVALPACLPACLPVDNFLEKGKGWMKGWMDGGKVVGR